MSTSGNVILVPYTNLELPSWSTACAIYVNGNIYSINCKPPSSIYVADKC